MGINLSCLLSLGPHLAKVLLSRGILACCPPSLTQPTGWRAHALAMALGCAGSKDKNLSTAGPKSSCHGIRCH